jgi:predicted RNA-binding Zn-ribbon protein involved in translation (DUF1610 family)
MFIIAGLSSKRHRLGTKLHTCPNCQRPSTFTYMLVKRAFSIFWIPIVPAWSRVKMRCQSCGVEMAATDAPTDTGFFGFLAISLALLVGGLMLSLISFCVTIILFIALSAAVAYLYMQAVPDNFKGYPGGSGVPSMETAIEVTPVYSTPSSQSQRAVTTDRSSTLSYKEGGYVVESVCPYCGMRITPAAYGPVVKCPYCNKAIQS